MKAVKIVSALCFVIFLNGFLNYEVSGQDKEIPNQTQKSVNREQTNQNDKSDKDNGSNNTTSNKNQLNERYRIGFQDTVEITVFRHPELSQVVNISPDGTIVMPRIDQPIVAVCKTERELKQTIENLYKTYLRTPFVNVRAVDQKSQSFAVIGAVEKPGSFFLNRRVQLLELLAFAGGPKVEKAGSKIQIARVGNLSACEENVDSRDEEGKVQFLSYKLNDVIDGKQNPWMQPGDIVSVLEAEEAYVVGNVFKPTKVSLKESVTLTQAIAIAGGLDATAKTNKIFIQRQESGNPVKTELVFDLKDIRAKKIPDPQLQANDIVEVTNDNIKSIRNGLIKVITGGLPNVFLRVPTP
ncbi:MAG: SLBB domain-containing protein [Pyrinomonadaceae bacterium]